MSQQSNSNVFTRLSAWLRKLDSKLEAKRKKLDDEQFFRKHVIACSGCQRAPMLTRFDDANSYHITCTTANCKDPHWLDCTIKNRSLKQALNEWYTLNTGQSLN